MVGTVNVDESTYMFSPKVLDRANVIEFRVSQSEIEEFLKDPVGVDLRELATAGTKYGKLFVETSDPQQELGTVPEEFTDKEHLMQELIRFFSVMADHNAEFGFRTAKEIARFVYFHSLLGDTKHTFEDAIDAQVVQKLLPKLNGSRAKLEELLWKLGALCFFQRDGKLLARALGVDETNRNFDTLWADTVEAIQKVDRKFNPVNYPELARAHEREIEVRPTYPISYEKIVRMIRKLEGDGFTSFAEA